jgi:hypothetical protein
VSIGSCPGAAALFSTHFLGAQAPPSADIIRDVAASPFTLVVRADGSVAGLGSDQRELGVKTAPTVIELLCKALLRDGSLRMWGHHRHGEIGNGTSGVCEPQPVEVTAIAIVAAVYLGNVRSYAVRITPCPLLAWHADRVLTFNVIRYTLAA